jgi:hypothetical protein
MVIELFSFPRPQQGTDIDRNTLDASASETFQNRRWRQFRAIEYPR